MTLAPCNKFEWQDFVLAQRQLSPMMRLVALRMSWFADVDGSAVRPGTEQVASGVGISARQAWRHVEDLRRLGLLELIVRGGGRGRRTANEYRLVLPFDDWDQRLAGYLEIRVTRGRQANPADTTDTQMAGVTVLTRDTTVSVVSAETTDTDAAETTDIATDTPDIQVSHHQSDTPAIDQSLGAALDGTADRASHHDEDDAAAARAAAAHDLLQRVGPVVMEQLLTQAAAELGADASVGELIEHAAWTHLADERARREGRPRARRGRATA